MPTPHPVRDKILRSYLFIPLLVRGVASEYSPSGAAYDVGSHTLCVEIDNIEPCSHLYCSYGMNGIIAGLLLPFLGTTLGAACVFLMKESIAPRLQKILTGFAAGVMLAASVWSLLIPSIEMTGKEGLPSIIPAIVGFMTGILFLLFLDNIIPTSALSVLPSASY